MKVIIFLLFLFLYVNANSQNNTDLDPILYSWMLQKYFNSNRTSIINDSLLCGEIKTVCDDKLVQYMNYKDFQTAYICDNEKEISKNGDTITSETSTSNIFLYNKKNKLLFSFIHMPVYSTKSLEFKNVSSLTTNGDYYILAIFDSTFRYIGKLVILKSDFIAKHPNLGNLLILSGNNKKDVKVYKKLFRNVLVNDDCTSYNKFLENLNCFIKKYHKLLFR